MLDKRIGKFRATKKLSELKVFPAILEKLGFIVHEKRSLDENDVVEGEILEFIDTLHCLRLLRRRKSAKLQNNPYYRNRRSDNS
jgi:hypothetical protein